MSDPVKLLILAVALGLCAVGAAQAEGTQRIENRDAFVQLIAGKSLKRFGIRLTVSPEGQITGRAFGKPVTGAWRWSGGYFCRDLFFGAEDLGPNCQVVERRGGVLRFISDKGQGQFADLRLD